MNGADHLNDLYMTVTVLLFASHREFVGKRQVQVQVARGATVTDVYDRLQDAYTGLAGLRAATSFAVNREVVAENAIVQNGDEVAFLQPVSGGSFDRIGA